MIKNTKVKKVKKRILLEQKQLTQKLKNSKLKKKLKKKRLSPEKELKRVLKEAQLAPKSSQIARQDLSFEFVFLNTTAHLDSIKFLKAVSTELKKRFSVSQRRKLQQRLKQFESCALSESEPDSEEELRNGRRHNRMAVNNGCMVLNHLKNVLSYFSERFFFVIIIDELDSLLKKDKKNFEFVVEFLNSEISNAVKIGVSNTFGISSQVFDYTVYAEISRLIFPQYSEADLVSIIRQRLRLALGPKRRAVRVVNEACLSFLAKKLMKNSWGDIRLLLKLFQQVLALKIRTLNNMKVSF